MKNMMRFKIFLCFFVILGLILIYGMNKVSTEEIVKDQITIEEEIIEEEIIVEEALTFNIIVTVNNVNYGTVSGGGSFALDSSVLLTAIPKAGYRFVSWQEAGVVVSNSYSYSFKVTEDRNIVAQFELIKTPVISSVVSIGYTSIKVYWGAVTGASHYEVFRATSPDGAYTRLGTTSNTSYISSGLTTGRTYYYKLRAACTTGTVITYGGVSGYKYAKPIPGTPAITAKSYDYNTVRISWVPIDGAHGYRVYRATSATGTYTFVGSTTKNYFYNSALATGRTYYYRVRVYHLEGSTYIFSNYSAYSTARPIPITPQVTGATLTSTTLKINWTAVTGAHGYRIYKATSPTGTYTYLGSTMATSYTSSTSGTARIFYYKVYAYHIEGSTAVLSNYVINKFNKLIPLSTYLSVTNIDAILEKARLAKGTTIGTSGKGVVSLRFDDYQNVFKTDIFPLLVARNLPSSMALISRFNTAQLWGIKATWTDVHTWNRNGVEIWSHGTDHIDYSPRGYTGLFEQIVTSKDEIENHDIKVVGWALPGVYPKTTSLPYNGLTDIGSYNSDVGRMLMHTYPLTEAYASGPRYLLNSNVYHGMSHVTVSDYGTLASAKSEVDYAIANKTGIELMCHAGNLGLPGKMTLSEFRQLLDYIKYQRDQGNIEVLTPSGMYFADSGSTSRLNLISDSGLTILKNSKTLNITGIKAKGYNGEQFMVEGWYKSGDGGTDSGYIKIVDINNSSNLSINKSIQTSSQEWTKVMFIMSIPVKTDNVSINLVNNTGSNIVWDRLSIKIL